MKMIINKISPISEVYVYKISDVEGDATDIASGVLVLLSSMSFMPAWNQDVEGIITRAISMFIDECKNRVWYFDYQDSTDLGTSLEKKLVPDCLDFIEKHYKYLELLAQEQSNLLNQVKTSTKYKQANADTPVTKKFDENYTLDDYISWLTINQSETSNDLGTIAQRLQEISDLYKGYSNELKNIFECNVLIYNTGVESEVI